MCGKFGILSLCLFFCVFCAGLVHAKSLQEVIEETLKTNPAILSADAAHQAAQHEKKSETAGYFPDISTGVTGGRVFQDNATSRGTVTTRGAAYSGYGEANIAMRQKIFDGFETYNRVGAANARMQSQNFLMQDMQGQIILNLSRSYIDVLRVSYALAHLAEQQKSIEDYHARIKKLVDEGAADETELQQAKDVAMIVQGAVAEYEGQLLSAKAFYREVSGQPLPEKVEIPVSLEPFINPDIEKVIQTAKEKHPSIKSAAMESKAAEHDVHAQIGQSYYPDIGAELSYLTSDKRDEIGGENEDARAVMRLNWDFSLGGRSGANVKQKRAEHVEARARKEETQRQIERDIYQSYGTYQTLQRQFALAQERVSLNKDLLASYKAQFEGSRISLLSLMRAESQLFNALLAENDNYFNMLSAEYAVLAATGDLKDVILNPEKPNE